jgi:hypothetical protein
MASLNEADRHALVLRFFYGRSMKEVGAALGGSEGAATLRLRRAVEKLRQFFLKRGIASTTEIIAGAISANSAQVAPAALAKYVTAVALTKGAAASGSTLTLIKGALKIMAWTKAKTAMAAGVAVILAVGTATPIIVHVVHQHEATPSFLLSTTKLTDTDNAKYQSLTGTTPAQVAQEILGTFARKDWTELAKYWHPDQHDMEQYEEQYGGIEVIKLGKPFSGRFRDKGHPAYHGVWVPYEIRFTNGGVRRFQLAIRCDNPDHRWYFDGGM